MDVCTYWNSKYRMLASAYAIRLDQFLVIQTGKISEKVVTAQEWESIAGLIDLLKPFDTVTKECSVTGYPTFHAALQNWEQLLMHLKEISAVKNPR